MGQCVLSWACRVAMLVCGMVVIQCVWIAGLSHFLFSRLPEVLPACESLRDV
jgi:hypothetical protein